MLNENPSLYYEWWKSVQQLDVPKIQQLASIHPHLIWTTTTEPSFLPSCSDTFQQLFDRDLGSSLCALNTIHWLILNYQLGNAKSMVTYILNMVDAKDLNDNTYWGDRENTMMHLVSVLGYDDLALQLVEKGVHANVPNSRGRLPQHVAQTDTMVELLSNIKDSNTVSPQNDGLSSSACNEMNNAQNQEQRQQQQQLIKPSTSSSSTNIEQLPTPTPSPSTLRKCGKDDHYFRPGQVEETKQKVLGDEQVELEKQRERRRKDIALLAQRSAVKNNPFVKKLEPSAMATLDSDLLSPTSTHSDSSTSSSSSNAAILRIQANDLPHGERKCKRNSKGINSLQTKTYVSSSIFRQGQPLARNGTAKQNNTARQRLEKASIDKFDIATQDTNSFGDENNNDHVLESLSDDGSSSVVVKESLDFSPAHSTNLPAPLEKNNDDTDNDSDNDSKSDQSMVSALSSTDHGLQDSDSSLAVSENNDHRPSASDTTKLASSSSPPTPPKTISSANILSSTSPKTVSNTSTSSATSANAVSHTNTSSSTTPKAVSHSNISTKVIVDTSSTKVEQSSKMQLKTKKPTKLTRNDMLIRDHGTDSKRQSGSQKSHWSKELTTWVTILNREFSLNVDDDDLQNHGNTTASIDDLTLALEKVSKFGDSMKPESTGKEEDAKQQLANDNNSNKYEIEQYQQDMGNRLADQDDEARRRGMEVALGKYSEHAPKLYGSVSGRRPAAIYAKKAPLFDLMNLDSGDSSAQNNKTTLASLELSHSTSSPPPSSSNTSDHHLHHQQHYHHHNHQKQLQPQTQSHSTSTTNMTLSSKLFDRGKLYVRVNSVNDILLPLPRDRAHVRCVIGDGRYEYMSRYELLGQHIQFGFECIIDSHPDMIITLSLHVRPDYMLKKPLKRLFSSNRKRKGSLSAYVSNEDGAVGQTRFAVGDMLGACYKKPYAGCFYCFNAWHIHTAKDKPSSSTTSSSLSSASVTSSSSSSSSTTSSMAPQQQELDQGVLKVVGNFKVQLLYLPVLNPSSPVPRNLHECDMAIRAQL